MVYRAADSLSLARHGRPRGRDGDESAVDLEVVQALVDGSASTGWASRRGRPAPNTLVIERPQPHELDSIVIDSTRSQEIDYPGISARRIEIWGSTAAPDAGFRRLGVIEATQGGREDFPLPPGSRAQWLKRRFLRGFTFDSQLDVRGFHAAPQ